MRAPMRISSKPKTVAHFQGSSAVADHARLGPTGQLDNKNAVARYLAAAAQDPDPGVFLSALAVVAKARGMAQVAKSAGLGRESLYKALAPGAHPRFETIHAVLRALDVRFSVVAEM
jgi:probable addiction module antidote protein